MEKCMMTISIKFEDLVKAAEYIKKNSKDVHVKLYCDSRYITISFQNKDLSETTIKLFDEGISIPKISKEDPL
jgi:hypothetical protein